MCIRDSYRGLQKLVLGDITRTIFLLGVIVSILVLIGTYLFRNEVYHERDYYDRHGEPK